MPLPTASATLPAPIANTLLLYTTPVDDPSGQAYWAFHTLPPLPGPDPAAFDTLYGSNQGEGPARYFRDFRPQLSPDGRYILVPGLAGYPEYGVEGTGTWLIDLTTGAARELLPDGVIATWSPTSDAITYVKNGVLYALDIAAGATPTLLYENLDLWPLYAKWSPDGQSILAMTGVQDELTGDLTFTYWLVPAGGGPPRELARHETLGAEYSSSEISWSPDGQFLLMHNQVYDLDGNALLPEQVGGLGWLPDRSQLIHWEAEELRIISVHGEDVAIIPIGGDPHQIPLRWAFSSDGRRLAYSMQRGEEGIALAIHDLESGETQVVGTVPGALYVNLLRWSADDNLLITETDHGEGRYNIWTLETRPGGAVERLIENAELIEVVPYPVR